jgi:CheY-like chemotaxis protein
MAKKILLADDSLTIQKVVELTFSDSDYELVCVSNGQRALDRVKEDRPDLILADVVMPEKNGYEVCEAIKGDPTTARIPVILLSGTFEPFDRARAERIGADAIVPKPFDSHQLLAQVDALIARAPQAPEPPARTVEIPQTTAAIAIPPVIAPPLPPASRSPLSGPASEEAPFDVGFSAEDFTAAVRLPAPRSGIDPFEEEYGRGDVETAIEAFEKAHPRFGFGSALDTPISTLADVPLRREEPEAPSLGAAAAPASAPSRREEAAREPQWLREEPEKGPGSGPFPPLREELVAPLDFGSVPAADAKTVALRRSDFPNLGAEESPTLEFPHLDRRPLANTEDAGLDVEAPRPWLETAPMAPGPTAPAATVEISAQDADDLFEVTPKTSPLAAASPEPDSRATAEASSSSPVAQASSADGRSNLSGDGHSELSGEEHSEPGRGHSETLSGEIEMLAQRSSIPELTQMLSNVRATGDGGGEMTEEQLDRLATKVVEKLSDRIVREIAWEVIPDMAEIVIKQRIKELESGVE